MKTKWFIISLIALSLGCTRGTEPNMNFIDGEFTLYATSGENKTKTVLQQDGNVFWGPEDCIKVFYGNYQGKFTSTNTEPTASAEFTGTLGSFVIDGETDFIAVYPYSDNTVLGRDKSIISVFLPDEQTAVEGTFADELYISVAKSKDVNLHFYNVCGGVNFSLSRDDIKKVVFKGNNGEILAGGMAVEFNSDGIPVVTDFNVGRKSVILTAPEGETLKKGSWYYLVSAPQSLTKGYTMELYTDELVETITSDSPVTIRRSAWGVLKNMGNDDTPSMPAGAVDLGLPSGLKWASCNVGASAPEEYGDYFAWGETEPKSDYSSETYTFDSNPHVLLPLSADAASVRLGGTWRMPTAEEWDELLDECTWTWTTQNEVNGRLVTGPNGNSIFLPAAGDRYGTDLFDAGSSGYYWSSSRYNNELAYNAYFFSGAVFRNGGHRYAGYSVRAVTVSVKSVSLNKMSLTLKVGNTATLTATVLPDNATNKCILWDSDNESIVTVSSSGVVNAVAPGTAVIAVTTAEGGFTATCTIKVISSSSLAIPEAVDLGLPSGLKWASFNLGAISPEEKGDNYAWGETTPKSDYSWETYKFWIGTDEEWDEPIFSKYGGVDNKTFLDPEDDAAYFNLGGNCHIPTPADWDELMRECTWTGVTLSGVTGALVTGHNGNSVFLPDGAYWSSSVTDFGCAESVHLDWWDENDYDCYFDDEDRCSGFLVRPVSGEISAEGVLLNKSRLYLVMGRKASLTATFTPWYATKPVLIWSSSNSSIATVDANGTVTAVSFGTAIITANTSDGGITATCTVMVNATGIENGFELVDLSLPSGLKWATRNLGASTPEEYGDYYAWGETSQKVSYTEASYLYNNNYNSVLALEDDAAHVNLGGDWRIPTDEEWTELMEHCTWTWTEQNGVIGMLVTSNTNGYNIFLPAAGRKEWDGLYNHNNYGYCWSSSSSPTSPSHAWGALFGRNVVDYGYYKRYQGFPVRAVSPASPEVRVKSVSLNKTSLTLDVGNTATLKATVLPENATNQKVIWSSDKESVATISSSGVITAVSPGTAVITVATADGGKTANCKVTVLQSVTSVSLDRTSLELMEGGKVVLTAAVLPKNATNKEVTWTSDKESVATVSSSGVVTAKSAGTAVITVTTVDGGKTDNCFVTVLQNFNADDIEGMEDDTWN